MKNTLNAAILLASAASFAFASPIGELSSNNTVKRDFGRLNLCTPTGPGVCNFGLAELALDESGLFVVYNAEIYDNYCNVIGYNYDNLNPDDCVYSTLPNAVCLVTQTPVAFNYAGTFYSEDNGQCSCYYPDDGETTWCQCAFDC